MIQSMIYSTAANPQSALVPMVRFFAEFRLTHIESFNNDRMNKDTFVAVAKLGIGSKLRENASILKTGIRLGEPVFMLSRQCRKFEPKEL